MLVMTLEVYLYTNSQISVATGMLLTVLTGTSHRTTGRLTEILTAPANYFLHFQFNGLVK